MKKKPIGVYVEEPHIDDLPWDLSSSPPSSLTWCSSPIAIPDISTTKIAYIKLNTNVLSQCQTQRRRNQTLHGIVR